MPEEDFGYFESIKSRILSSMLEENQSYVIQP